MFRQIIRKGKSKIWGDAFQPRNWLWAWKLD